MKENISFRSSFNGFNRDDVVGYISGLMEKIAEQEQETDMLARQADEMAEALDAMRNSSREWEREREELNMRCASLEKDCASWKDRCAALEDQHAEWEKQRAQANTGWEKEREDARAGWEKERTEMRERIESLERQVNECGRNSRSNEEKLGAAMMEAKRFSEMLVKEAHDRAGAVYQNASVCVNGSTEYAERLREQMKALNFEFTKMMGSVMSDMNGLIEAMKSFNHDLRDNGAKFLYESEFTGEEG